MSRGEQCPKCKGKQIVYSGTHHQQRKCKNCGHEWKGMYTESQSKKEHTRF